MKAALVLQTARFLGRLSRLSAQGGGTALPGLLVQRAAPELISNLSRGLSQGVILVTGTNGKTTTSRIIAAVLTTAGYRVVHNRAGSNLMRGIASALVSEGGDDDGSHGSRGTFGLFEVDEATMPEAIQLLQPHLVVVLNLFRDQLDRYGEVDTIAQRWREGLAHLPAGAQVVLNADDPLVASLGRGLEPQTSYFGLEDTSRGSAEQEHAADFVECATCARPYDYCTFFYGHLGHYRCPSCGWQRPTPTVQCTRAETRGLAGAHLTLGDGESQLALEWRLPGLYNAYNLLAAAAAAASLGLPLEATAEALKGFEPAFGRAEQFQIGGKPAALLLTKNPVGTNQVLRMLGEEPGAKPLLIALNDYTADGEDVSWIWDVDYEILRGQVKWVVTSGHRAADMALRLKYAGWFEWMRQDNVPPERPTVLVDLEQAIKTAVYRLEPGETLYILATYTAMLELRQVLTHMGVLRPFWEER